MSLISPASCQLTSQLFARRFKIIDIKGLLFSSTIEAIWLFFKPTHYFFWRAENSASRSSCTTFVYYLVWLYIIYFNKTNQIHFWANAKTNAFTQFSVHNIFRIFFKIYTIIYICLEDDKAAAKTRRISRHCAKGLLSGLSRPAGARTHNEAERWSDSRSR